jgi:hypothetical protein
MTKPILLSFLLLACWGLAESQVIYVKTGAQGTGSSWTDATGDLRAALSMARPGTQVWVARGIYFPTQCVVCTARERAISFRLSDSVQLYGGFAGTESTLGERIPELYATVLSGDIDGDGLPDSNSYNVTSIKNASPATVIDGFTIRDGNADHPSALGAMENSGAGIFNQGQLKGFSSSPVIRNCKFIQNHALGFGGAVYNDGSFSGIANPVFQNCFFEKNSARKGGGAIANIGTFEGECNPQLTDCVFQENESEFGEGGAIYNSGSEKGVCSPFLTNCQFFQNHAVLYGGAIFNFGKTGHSSPVLAGCFFYENNAEEGGAVYNDGSFHGSSSPEFQNCGFLQNSVHGDGGAVYNLGSEGGSNQALFRNCFFEKNTCDVAGAAVFNNGYIGNCEPTFRNCRFTRNVAKNYAGALYNLGNSGLCKPLILNCLFSQNSAYSAGAIYNLGSNHGDCSPDIVSCTFYQNTAEVGGAVYCNASDSTGRSQPLVTNCIFYGNKATTGPVFRNIFGAPRIRYSLFDIIDCNVLESGYGSQVHCEEGLIFNTEMVFQDTASNDLHLQQGTIAVDAGDSTATTVYSLRVDLDGNARVRNTTVDLGAYEMNPAGHSDMIILKQPVSVVACQGSSARLEMQVISESRLQFQWSKNEVNIIGATDSVLVIEHANFSHQGLYRCIANDGAEELFSGGAFLAVRPFREPIVEILNTVPAICELDSLHLECEIRNGGTQPLITWYLNGSEVIGQNTNKLGTMPIQAGSEIRCKLVSGEVCLTNQEVLSSAVFVPTRLAVAPTVRLLGPDTVCAGDTAIFEALIENGGAAPQVEWYVNGQKQVVDSVYFSSANLVNGDAILLKLISTDTCVLTNTATATKQVIVKACPVAVEDPDPLQYVRVYPNPAKSLIFIELSEFDWQDARVRLLNGFGREMLIPQWERVSSGVISFGLDGVCPGVYLLEIRRGATVEYRKLCLMR